MYRNWLLRVAGVTLLRLAGVFFWLKAAVALMTPLMYRPFRGEDSQALLWATVGAFLGFLATRFWKCPQCGHKFWDGPPVLARFFYHYDCPQCRFALRR